MPSSLLLATLLECIAAFDESSHYELSAPTEARGTALFRYVTEDGLDLQAKLTMKEWAETAENFRLVADDGNMRVTLGGTKAAGEFPAALRVEFSLDHAEPVELEARCRER